MFNTAEDEHVVSVEHLGETGEGEEPEAGWGCAGGGGLRLFVAVYDA